jgi:hypothetical protein
MLMRIISLMAPTLVAGTKRQRIIASSELGIRLSLAGYFASTVVPIIDKPIAANLAGMHIVLATAIVVTILSAFIKPV